MSFGYRTLLTHFDTTPRSSKRLMLASSLAESFEAHLTAIYSVMSPLYTEPFVSDGGAFIAQELIRLQQRKDSEARARFDEVSRQSGRPIEWCQADGNPAAVVNEYGRCADLIVLGQYDPDQANDITPDFIGRVILGSGRPVLVVPYAGDFQSIGKRPMVAWNGGREAARAISAAMPLLRRAEMVQVNAFDVRSNRGAQGDLPGADIATYLSRHGVKANVSTSTGRDVDIGNQMLSRAEDENIDLIVMGGYGHSRAFEFIMGGTTRTLLESMTVPVLFAH